MKRFFVLLVLLLLTTSVGAAEEYYRSLDGTGNVHYGDKPLPDAADYDKVKPLSEPVPDEYLPFATRRAKKKFPVLLYVADNCGKPCDEARTYLNKRGIPYTEKNLTTDDEVEAFKQASGGEMVPTMNINKDWHKGFLESQWGMALDTSGYPKVAPYGIRRPITSIPAEKATKP